MAEARTIADIAADIADVDSCITDLNKQVAEKKKERIPLEKELKDAAALEELTGGKTATHVWEIKEKTVPLSNGDWPAFYEYMTENGYFHLLQQRLTIAGCEELWSKGVSIPGVDKFTKIEVKVKEK